MLEHCSCLSPNFNPLPFFSLLSTHDLGVASSNGQEWDMIPGDKEEEVFSLRENLDGEELAFHVWF